MKQSEMIKNWLVKNKKQVLIGSATAAISIVGACIAVVLSKDNGGKRLSVSDWVQIASKADLENVYEKERQVFLKTGTKSYIMEKISHELGLRGAREWAEKHPPNLDPYFRWTDANRWEKD